jgi:cytochrome c oxidase assembly protein subunit 15
LDAGHAYNTFPLMAGRLVPEEYWALPGWRNAFENTATVQLHHRALALSTLAAVSALWLRSRGLALPPSSRMLVQGMMGMAALQASHTCHLCIWRCIVMYALLKAKTISGKCGTSHITVYI